MLPIPLLVQFFKLSSCCAEHTRVRYCTNALVKHDSDLRATDEWPLNDELNCANSCSCFDCFGCNGLVAILELEEYDFDAENCIEDFASVDLISSVGLRMRCLLHEQPFYLDACEFFFVAVHGILFDALNRVLVVAL